MVGGIFQKVEGPLFAGGPSRGAGANEGEESPTRFLFYIGENVGGALGWLFVHLLGGGSGLFLTRLHSTIF